MRDQGLAPMAQNESHDFKFIEDVDWGLIERASQSLFEPKAHLRMGKNPFDAHLHLPKTGRVDG
jgi:hypothetical protein